MQPKLTDAQRELVAAHIGLVKKVAVELGQRLPQSVSFDDLVQDGTLGLMQAATTFDASLGHTFLTHAGARIKGAMLDAIRERDEISRDARQRQRSRLQAEEQLGEASSPETVCKLLGWDEARYRRSFPPEVDTLFKVLASDGRDATLVDQLGTIPGREGPDRRVDQLERVRELFRGLNLEEQIVVYLFFWKSKKLAEIGQVLDLSASRVQQIKTIVLKRLERLGRDELTDRAR